MPPLANQLAEIQRQQQVLKVLQETQSSLEGFRNTVTGVLEPSTGHVDVDYLVGEARGLLGELSETIGGLLEPLNQVSAATSGITHTLQGIATLVETGRRVDQLTGPELAEQFTRYVSHLTGAAQAVGVLNPVIGSYLTVLGEGLNGMGENLKIIAARAEVTNQVVTEERLRAFGEFVERAVQVQPARPSEGSDALRREADRLWERQQDLWNEFRHSDWAIDQALIELRPDWPDHERRAWVKWFPEAWSSVAKGHLLDRVDGQRVEDFVREIRERAAVIAHQAVERALQPPAAPPKRTFYRNVVDAWAWLLGGLLIMLLVGGVFYAVGYDPEIVEPVAVAEAREDEALGERPEAAAGIEVTTACVTHRAFGPWTNTLPERQNYFEGLNTLRVSEGTFDLDIGFDGLPDSEVLLAEVYYHFDANNFFIVERRDTTGAWPFPTGRVTRIEDGRARFEGAYVLNENPIDAAGMSKGEQSAWFRFRVAGVAVYVLDAAPGGEFVAAEHEPVAVFGRPVQGALQDTPASHEDLVPEVIEVTMDTAEGRHGICPPA